MKIKINLERAKIELSKNNKNKVCIRFRKLIAKNHCKINKNHHKQ